MSRSKNRKIADLISGGTFDDGVVAASEVTGLATVATSGSFSDLSNQPTPFDPSTLGTASTQATGAFATVAQGTTADAALPKAGGAVTGNVTFGDNNKAIFGAGSDLQIYHDGSHSYIDEAGTGDIYVSALDDIIFRTYGTNELVARFNTNQNTGGWARLYHRGSEKLETTSTGIDVTGTVNADALTGIGSIDATTAAAIGAAGVGGGGLTAWNPNATPNQTFTSSGTWTKPAGAADSTYVVFYMVGGGSSGGHYYGGPAGFGGGASILTATMGGLPSSISVTVGAGGARQTYFGYSTNVGGNSSISSNSITYTAGGASGGSGSDTVRFPPLVIFPVVESPFTYDIPTSGSATAGSIPSTGYNGVQNGAGSIFAAGDGGNVNPNHNGTGGSSTYAGNGGAGNMTYGANGAAPGGGGGGSYTTSGASGGAGGNGSVRVYYIT